MKRTPSETRAATPRIAALAARLQPATLAAIERARRRLANPEHTNGSGIATATAAALARS